MPRCRRMLTRKQYLLCTLLVCLGASTVLAQASVAEFQTILGQKAAFAEPDFATLRVNQPVVGLAPTSDKSEIAVSGVINIRAGADEFLRSYRESMVSKNNDAILEIGRFGAEPALRDLESLTIEPADIEDLKDCVVGDCRVKLSASMIELFRKQVDWQAPDYQLQAANLFKRILSDYARDYVTRGEPALIEYNDKRDMISLAAEQRALSAASSYIGDLLTDSNSGLQLLQKALVWSKIKFGLKPVIAINQISIYRRNNQTGPQVLIASKQIYASHYFNASQSLMAFVSVPGATEGAYLVYENRSRADSLGGPFGKIKRDVVEKKALAGLRGILQQSKASLEGTELAATTAELDSYQSYGWTHRLFGGVRPLLWLLMLSALIALLVLGRRRTEVALPKKPFKPESANS